jgi:hypothetical protein
VEVGEGEWFLLSVPRAQDSGSVELTPVRILDVYATYPMLLPDNLFLPLSGKSPSSSVVVCVGVKFYPTNSCSLKILKHVMPSRTKLKIAKLEFWPFAKVFLVLALVQTIGSSETFKLLEHTGLSLKWDLDS